MMFPDNLKIKIVVATARSEQESFENTPMGRWLPLYGMAFVELRLAADNTKVFWPFITECSRPRGTVRNHAFRS